MKCLVIDDEPLVRRSLLRVLQVRGHQGFEAEDGPKGLAIWRELQPDLVFVDILMPGMSGPDVVSQVLPGLTIRPFVVLMSAYSGEDSERLAADCGANYFLAKPFEDLFAVVDEAIERSVAAKSANVKGDG